MLPKYYQEELATLKELGAEFSKAHPSLAPMLSGTRSDPDVERLLEGSAFLTALLRQKLDDEFPEIVHDLLQTVAPHYLNPLPSATIQVFQPKAVVRNSLRLPAGIYCASVPVEGTSCLFKTSYPVEIHPMAITNAAFIGAPGHSPLITISFELNGISLSQWKPESLRLFLADDFSKAADLYFLLRRHVKAIHFVSEGADAPFSLGAQSLKPVGFETDERLGSYPSNAYSGFGTLQEYFTLPQKFLFLDIVGWREWQSRGNGTKFELQFELENPPFALPRLSKNSFVLHATPAVNVFPHDADPINLDHRRTNYLIRPEGNNSEHYQVNAVDEVKGFIQGTSEERTYAPFDHFRPATTSTPVYHLTRRLSTVNEGVDMYLSVDYPSQESSPQPETLSLRLSCTNGTLPGKLKAGDVCIHAKGCPEYVTFTNILTPSPGLPSPIGKNLLWRLLSHLSIGFQSLEKVETLKSLLELYVTPDTGDSVALANQKRIDSIASITVKSADRLVSGVVMRGRELTLTLREDHFAGRGDLYLFGCILDNFFANYASINSFTCLTVKELFGGPHYTWPAKMGNRHLI